MNAQLRLPCVTEARSVPILLVHSAVFATMGTLIMANDAQVRKLGRTMPLDNIEYELFIFF